MVQAIVDAVNFYWIGLFHLRLMLVNISNDFV